MYMARKVKTKLKAKARASAHNNVTIKVNNGGRAAAAQAPSHLPPQRILYESHVQHPSPQPSWTAPQVPTPVGLPPPHRSDAATQAVPHLVHAESTAKPHTTSVGTDYIKHLRDIGTAVQDFGDTLRPQTPSRLTAPPRLPVPPSPPFLHAPPIQPIAPPRLDWHPPSHVTEWTLRTTPPRNFPLAPLPTRPIIVDITHKTPNQTPPMNQGLQFHPGRLQLTAPPVNTPVVAPSRTFIPPAAVRRIREEDHTMIEPHVEEPRRRIAGTAFDDHIASRRR